MSNPETKWPVFKNAREDEVRCEVCGRIVRDPWFGDGEHATLCRACAEKVEPVTLAEEIGDLDEQPEQPPEATAEISSGEDVE